MPIAGLIGTGAFGGTIGSPDTIPAFERPTNWRQGILMRFPNGHAPITALTAVMKKKVTDDPQYHWWEREMSNTRLELTSDINNSDSQTALDVATDPFGFGGEVMVKKGDILRLEKEVAGDYELMYVNADPTAGSDVVNVTRGYAGSSKVAVVVLTDTDNPYLTVVGSVYEEGSDTPRNVRYRASKIYNYTQIFRNSLQATRTALNTRLRTVDEVRDAKTQTLLYHSIAMEYGFLFGKRYEVAGANGNPERMTGGIVEFIPASNIQDEAGTALMMSVFEDYMLEAFRFGSQEKMGFCGNRAILAIQRMARTNASLEITPTIKEFGMDVRRVFTPYGTLVLKTHPLFNQITSESDGAGGFNFYGLDSWLLILDMANIAYRPLRNSDTQYLPDRQANGIDGLSSEYLTEAGLEINHAKTHYLIKGLVSGQVDG